MFGSCEKFLDHVRINICAGDKKQYDLLIAWLADLVQNPTKTPGTAVVLRGCQGTGKSIFARVIGALFFQHFLYVSDSRHFMGRFNAHLKDCIVLFADEAFMVGGKSNETILKMLITEDNICIERQGYDTEIVPNHVHIIMSVNTDWVVPTAFDDRRFLVFDVADNRCKDTDYFAAIISELNTGGYAALEQHLRSVGQHEWKEYGKSWEQFCKDGLNSSGTQVRITNRSVPNEATTYLIGDVSENGNQGTEAASICTQCVEIQQEEIVIRYRVMEIDNG